MAAHCISKQEGNKANLDALHHILPDLLTSNIVQKNYRSNNYYTCNWKNKLINGSTQPKSGCHYDDCFKKNNQNQTKICSILNAFKNLYLKIIRVTIISRQDLLKHCEGQVPICIVKELTFRVISRAQHQIKYDNASSIHNSKKDYKIAFTMKHFLPCTLE